MKKNLLYVFADQWAKKAIGFEGAQIPTPHMDKFAEESMVFDNAISSYPLCSPHRAALFTGKEPYSCGMWTNCKIGLDEVLMLKPQEVTIGNVLKDAGYGTAYIGKWHLDASEMNFFDEPASGSYGWGAYTPEGERRQGFDFWYSYGAMNNHLSPHYWQHDDRKITHDRWSPEVETDVAIDYLKERDTSKPFCMFISWNPPHPPYDQVPEGYVDLIGDIDFPGNVPEEMQKDSVYQKAVREYYGAIAGLDDNFGRLLAYLEEAGLAEDTIVVLSADHGDMMGAQGLMGKNIWYEESIQIPLMVRGQGLTTGHSDVLLASKDHMPTLLDLLDCPIPETVQGRSYKGVLDGGMTEEAGDVFICMLPGMPELVEPFRVLGLNNKAFGWRGLRTKTHTYVIDNGDHPEHGQRRLLYDLKADPLQLAPITLDADDPRCEAYDERLKAHLKAIKDPFMVEMKGRQIC